MKRPFITAHTGCLNTPPNSIQSVMEGLNAGADIIEVDVRATKDGVAVLLHDEGIPTPSGVKRIQDLSFEDATRFNKKAEIVRLEEILPLIQENHRVINLDVKDDSAIDPMIRTVEQYKMRDYSIISGCEKERALFLKGRYRPYQVLLNASKNLFMASSNDYSLFIEETCLDATAASCCGININYHFCREELIDFAALRCLPVLVWTVDDAPEMERFLDIGVHSITSKEVKTLIDLRNNRNNGGK